MEIKDYIPYGVPILSASKGIDTSSLGFMSPSVSPSQSSKPICRVRVLSHEILTLMKVWAKEMKVDENEGENIAIYCLLRFS